MTDILCYTNSSKWKKPPKICKHLDGPEYNEYILRTHTRTLGGISPDLRATAVRNLFPYKGLPPIKDGPTKKADWLLITPKKASKSATNSHIPADGNREQRERAWTDAEKKKLDQFLTGWARWIVDYNMAYARATKCQGTTSNANGICDECWLVAKDESFRTAVRRVCVFKT